MYFSKSILLSMLLAAPAAQAFVPSSTGSNAKMTFLQSSSVAESYMDPELSALIAREVSID